MNTHKLPDFEYQCFNCGLLGELDEDFICPGCQEPRALMHRGEVDKAIFSTPPENLWHYSALLPIADATRVQHLGEGATPLVKAPRLAKTHGIGRILLKNEMANPSGSFKDRQVSVGIHHAQEMGAKTVTAVSSGNVASATSAFAARLGMKAIVFMHGQASPAKIAQAAVYGARVIRVNSPAPSEAFHLCLKACERWGWYHCSTAGMYNPFNVEGAKTIAYELYYQTGGELPDWIVAPVGGGGLLGGIWRGLLDLKRLGLIETLPRIAGIQPTGCAPLIRAIDGNESFLESIMDPWPDPKSIAGGLADDILFDGQTALPAIRRTNGVAIAVDDEAIFNAVGHLATQEGLMPEFCSAVTIAALDQIPDCDENTTVCCILTGNGIKDVGAIAKQVEEPPLIDADIEALAELIG